MTAMPRLLMIEDETAIAEPLGRALHRDGYDVEHASTGQIGLELVRGSAFDIVLLDLGLPDVDGIELCRQIRSIDAQVRVVMLTARSEEVDTVVGLDAGADDYVAKPFRLAELLARIRAQLRRSGTGLLQVGLLVADPAARRASIDGHELDLTAKEFDLLAILMSHLGSVVTREQLMSDVWDQHWDGSTKTLDVHISSLRRKIGDDPSDPQFITTLRGVGYRFESP